MAPSPDASPAQSVPQRRSVALLATTFIVLVCLSMLVMQLWQAMRTRDIQLAEAEASATNLAHAVAQHAYDTLKQADTILVGLVERLEKDGLPADDPTRLRQLLISHVNELPQMHALFVIGPDGGWLLNSRSNSTAGQDSADREYYLYHRDHRDRGAHIGPPILGRASGAWVVTVSRRLERPDGSFAGVVMASIDMHYFSRYYQRFAIGRSGAIFVALDNGVMLVRRPFEEKSLGRDISRLPLFRDYLPRAPAGTSTFTSGQDGVTRINSYRRVQQYPLVVSAALSQSEMLSGWRADAWLHAVAVATLTLGLALLGMRLLKQIRLRAEAEGELLTARHALESLNRTLAALAMQDGLTGLANRRHFDAALQEEFSRAVRNASPLALIMIDVDCFKQYNDIYGHAAGDACLRAIGKAVAQGRRRPGDLTARYGGEELAVLLPGADVAGAVAVGENIRLAIELLELTHAGCPGGRVTVSVGVEAFVPATRDRRPLDLVEAADKALYQAKAGGRNRVCARSEVLEQCA
ncbi:sensor domain-containing diguanylate cyclase [Rugamonas sp. DEMB1]|uniref:sensor domain-containing diguanylate cyclase n=1 Tax=Rugamonas sp. DEMB1 TaxID=3039386 RepID=UPI002448C5D9|nr:sensor domain-containing diguanylate cyclase [Rugamonas sp. DEMB1]WGG53049.1 sensor domain-containing diguanylate cyclase [Rugamonas sp. DEMB1]